MPFKIKEARKEKGFTQGELAKRANVSRAASAQRFVRWTSMWSARPIMPNVSGAESASGPAPSMPSAIAMAWMCRRKSSP